MKGKQLNILESHCRFWILYLCLKWISIQQIHNALFHFYCMSLSIVFFGEASIKVDMSTCEVKHELRDFDIMNSS